MQMDDRGFIFTADASLALIVILIVSASITAYIMAPYSMGQDHQHLQALASDTLETMEKDGTLTLAAVKYSQGDDASADQILRSRVNILIPSEIGYDLNMLSHNVRNDSRILTSGNTATAVRVISGPEEGYLGRAWYKHEQVNFTNTEVNLVSTVWNFHNYLTNFNPWNQGNRLYDRQFWGVTGSSPGSGQNIQFSIPEGAIIHNAFFLQGSNNESASDYRTDPSYGVNVNINGHIYRVNGSSFTYLYPRSGNGLIYNYKGDILPGDLNTGSTINNFYVNFANLTGTTDRYGRFTPYNYNMPWFSLLANYTTNISVPYGIRNNTTEFPDAAGLGRSGTTGRSYDLSTGTVSDSPSRTNMNWNTFVMNRQLLNNYDDGVPFVISNLPGVTGTGHGSAVSIVQTLHIDEADSNGIPPRIFDGYVNINAYGAVDGALVEVSNNGGTTWRTAFCSFDFDGQDYTGRSDGGYGNTPGIIYIGKDQSGVDLLRPGDNLIRITVWDHVPSNDYDLVGLVDCKAYAYFSFLPIDWETFAFPSYQAADSNSVNTYTFPNNDGRTFSIGPDARKVYLFMGTGTATRNVKVEVRNTTSGWQEIYNGATIPYMLDLGALDAGGPHRFTSGTADNYTLNEGTFRVRVTLTTSNSWQSGDGGTAPKTYGDPTIFSGTRVAVIYPEFLENLWTTSYNSTAEAAKAQARSDLVSKLGFDPGAIQTEAIYTGNLPNAIPVRLDLWK
ncbi:MAG: hypothetical protein FGO69_11195 [Methanobacterium sp.]|nr:MAG: hypothetical protein FGO69_11195 [Methanobacterium sp.]